MAAGNPAPVTAVVNSVVDFTVERTGELLIQQVGYSHGVRGKVDSIEKDLRWMQSFLQDVDGRLGEADQRVKTLVKDVSGVCRRVEDAIGKFRSREDRRRRRRGPFKKCIYAFSDFLSLREIGETIEAIKKEISDISSRKTLYGVPGIDGGEVPSYASRILQNYRRASALTVCDEVVGFTEDANALVERLIRDGSGDGARLHVVSIVGPEGAGKTTLASKVCKSDDVRNYFGDSVAWVCASQNYSAIHLLQKIATEFKQDSEGLNVKELQERLSEFLLEKRYLVVLDDMWDGDAWDQLKAAFPDTRNGSGIILTTRNERVALHADPDPANPPYRLPLLNPDDSWKLFLKKAFPWEETSTQMPCSSSSELVDIGKQIVAKCGGLPLAISVVGGILAAKGKANVKDWRDVLAGNVGT